MSGGTAAAMAGAAGYLVGSIPFADAASRLARRRGRAPVDLRRAGTGNPGALNAARVLGPGWGGTVMVADVAKGAAAALVGAALGNDAATAAAGLAAVVGHLFPVWSRGRGGKGVAAFGGATIAILPAMVPLAAAATVAVLAVRRRVRPAVLVGCAAFTLEAMAWWGFGWRNAWGPQPGIETLTFALLGSGLVASRFARPVPRGEVSSTR